MEDQERHEHHHHQHHERPTHEEIATAAYYLWLAECVSAEGADDEQLIRPAEENWLAAEASLGHKRDEDED